MRFNTVTQDGFTLDDNAIHVWFLNKEHAIHDKTGFAELLSPDERERAGKIIKRENRDQYIVTRGILRILLSRYLHIPPQSVRFNYRKNGKPEIDIHDDPKRQLKFNLSHSGGCAVFVFCMALNVGVDIQEKKRLSAIQEVSRYFLSAEIREHLDTLPPHRQVSCYYQCWSRAEALLKATGLGLNGLTGGILPDISMDTPFICRFSGKQWAINDLNIDDKFSAAVCTEKKPLIPLGFLLQNSVFESLF